MKLFAEYTHRKFPFYKVELYFSVLHFLSGGKRWFCRIWQDGFSFTESYGANKFEAYRKALTLKP